MRDVGGMEAKEGQAMEREEDDEHHHQPTFLPVSKPSTSIHNMNEAPNSPNLSSSSSPAAASEEHPHPHHNVNVDGSSPPSTVPQPSLPAAGSAAIYGKRKPPPPILLHLILRLSASFMFLIALCIMATNQSQMGSQIIHGYAFRYVDAVCGIGLAYSAYQFGAALFLLISGRSFLPPLVSQYLTCIVDQVLAYMVISASSAGVATVMEAQETCDVDGASSYCSQAAGSISVLFLTFGVVATSAAFSFHNLVKHMYA